MVFISLWIFRNPIKCLTTIFFKVMLAARWYSVAIKAFFSNFRGKDYTQFKDDKKMHVFLLFKVGHTSLALTSCIVKREQFSAFRFKWYIHTLKGLNKLNWKKLMETIDFNINEFLLVLFWIVQFICNWFCKDPWFHFSKQQ